MQKLVYVILFLTLVACSNAKKVQQNISSSQLVGSDSSALYRFGIYFYSIGTGIDGAAKQEMLDYLKVFEQMAGVTITYEKYAWGREGEVDYCFKLKELIPTQQEYFIKQMKLKLKNATHINYKENTNCAH